MFYKKSRWLPDVGLITINCTMMKHFVLHVCAILMKRLCLKTKFAFGQQCHVQNTQLLTFCTLYLDNSNETIVMCLDCKNCYGTLVIVNVTVTVILAIYILHLLSI